jgi:hypothetical protein
MMLRKKVRTVFAVFFSKKNPGFLMAVAFFKTGVFDLKYLTK